MKDLPSSGLTRCDKKFSQPLLTHLDWQEGNYQQKRPKFSQPLSWIRMDGKWSKSFPWRWMVALHWNALYCGCIVDGHITSYCKCNGWSHCIANTTNSTFQAHHGWGCVSYRSVWELYSETPCFFGVSCDCSVIYGWLCIYPAERAMRRPITVKCGRQKSRRLPTGILSWGSWTFCYTCLFITDWCSTYIQCISPQVVQLWNRMHSGVSSPSAK